MDGLFGTSMDDPRTSMMLALASGLLGNRGNFGQGLSAGLMGGMGAYQDAQKMRMLASQQEMQRKIQQAQLDEQQRAASQRDTDNRLMQEFSMPRYPVGATVMKPKTMAGGPLPIDPLEMVRAGASPTAATTLSSLQAPKTIKVGKDDTILDARTYKPLFASPSDRWKDIGPNDRGQLIQQNERTGEKRAVGQGPLIGSISVNGKGENPFLESFGSTVGKDQAAVLAEGRQAADALTTIGQLRQIAKSPSGVSGGPFADWQTFMLGAANQFGVQLDPNRLANDQNYRAEAIGLVLQQAGSLSKATEKEMAMVRESIADPTKFNSVSLDMRLAVLENKAKRNVAQAKALQDRISRTYPGKFPTLSSETVIGTDTPFTPIPTPEQSRATPAVGARGKTKDGRNVEWDGKGWKVVP